MGLESYGTLFIAVVGLSIVLLPIIRFFDEKLKESASGIRERAEKYVLMEAELRYLDRRLEIVSKEVEQLEERLSDLEKKYPDRYKYDA